MNFKRLLFIICFKIFALVFSLTSSPVFANQHPLYLTILNLRPQSPQVFAQGKSRLKSSFTYSSIYTNEPNNIFDMEITCLELSLDYGLGFETQLNLEVPIIAFGPGFLDQFLIAYHRTVGLPDYYNRSSGPINRFQYQLKNNSGTNLNNAEANLYGLGDLRLSLKKLLREDLALLLAVKVPTGSRLQGFGSGSFDYGFQLLWQRYNFNFGFGRVILGSYKGNYELALASSNNAYIYFSNPTKKPGRDYFLQLEAQGSILPDSSSTYLQRSSLELSVGLKEQDWSLSFSEDLAGAAPDFSLKFERKLW